MQELDEKYESLRKIFAEGNLDKLSIEQLTDYYSMVMKHGNRNQLNSDTYNRLTNEISNIKRHKELKKTHWSVIPSLIIGFAAMVAAGIAAYFAVYPRSPQSSISDYSSPESKQSVQSVASSSQKQLQHTQTQLSTSRKKLP
jgi:cytoskeletal protein RodZ